MDRIQVAYSRKVSQQVADGKFETISLGGSVEFDVAEGEQWQDAYEGAYVAYKLIVDQLVDEALPKAEVAVSRPATLPGESFAQRPAPAPASSGGRIVANEPVEYNGIEVERVETAMTRSNKEWAKVRIKGSNLPMKYMDAKSFEPQIVARLKALQAGDVINVGGYFEPWKVNPDKFDLVVQRVDRAA